MEPDKLVVKLKSEYLKSAEYLESELLKIHVKSDSDQFINLKGIEPIFDKVKAILNSSEKEIYINTNVSLDIFHDEIEKAIERGVRIVLFSFEKHDIKNSKIEVYSKTDTHFTLLGKINKRLMLVSDMKEVIIGSSDENENFTGTYTKNSLLVNITAEHIHNDVYLYKLENKFGTTFWNSIKINTLNEAK